MSWFSAALTPDSPELHFWTPLREHPQLCSIANLPSGDATDSRVTDPLYNHVGTIERPTVADHNGYIRTTAIQLMSLPLPLYKIMQLQMSFLKTS